MLRNIGRDLDLHPLITRGGRGVWGSHGWRWMPGWLGAELLAVWNPLACWRLGHLWMDENMAQPTGTMVCSYCCAERPATVEERETWQMVAAQMAALRRKRRAEEL